MIQSETDAPEESDLWTAWQLFPLDDDQTCHSKDIEWAIELLYNSVKTGSQWVWRSENWWQDVVEKASIQLRAEPPGLRLSSPGERERDADGHKSGGQYVAVLFSLQLPLTRKPFQIKLEVHIFLKDCVARLHCVVVFCMNLHMSIQHNAEAILVGEQ